MGKGLKIIKRIHLEIFRGRGDSHEYSNHFGGFSLAF